MCGIIGYLGKQKAATIILEGLAVALQRDVDKPRILAKSVTVE
jgi:glucosamine 6-phosphate synthetase-like amidotransferase/phosphosugar isomerase protein